MIQFAVVFTARDLADAAGHALTADGYSTDVQESGSRWVLSVTTGRPLDGQSIDDASARMTQVAETFGGDYLGHGGFASTGMRHEP